MTRFDRAEPVTPGIRVGDARRQLRDLMRKKRLRRPHLYNL